MEVLGIITYDRSGSKVDFTIHISTFLHSLGNLLNPPPVDMILGLACKPSHLSLSQVLICCLKYSSDVN